MHSNQLGEDCPVTKRDPVATHGQGPESDREFAGLLQQAIDGNLEPNQGPRLQQLMQQVPARMDVWVDHFRLDSYLANEIDRDSVVDLVDLVCDLDPSQRDQATSESRAGGDAEPVSSRQVTGAQGSDAKGSIVKRPAASKKWRLLVVAAAIAATVMFFIAMPSWKRLPPSVAPITRFAPVDDSIAMVVQTSNDVWVNRVEPPFLLSPGRLQLESGLAELRIYNGVTLYLEGPVDLDLVSLDSARLRRGKLRANVPDQAEGFTVVTDEVRLVDRGTEFAISAGEDGLSQVHVFDGLVDLYPSGEAPPVEANKRAVNEGESVEIDSSFSSREANLNLADFPSPAAIDQSVASRFESWRAWSAEFATRPDLLLYYNFEEFGEKPNGRNTVVDQSQFKSINATVVGSELLKGRWPQKKAYGFYRSADRLRVNIPGRWPKLTLACWVRVDELRGVNQALLLTDTFEEWQPHWQISKEGTLKLGIGQETVEASRRLRSPSTPLEDLGAIGRWMHLATVYNSSNNTVSHYVNGIAAGAVRLPVAEPLRIGTAEIGNWLKPRKAGDEPIRNLDGRIDEFVLFREALDAQEIQAIYEAGR